MLEPIGLSADAEAVYRTLIANPGWSQQDIAENLSLNRAAMRSAVARLQTAVLVDADGDEDRLVLTVPETSLVALLHQAEQDLQKRREQLDLARAAITALTADHVSGTEIQHTLTCWDGLDAVRERLVELSAQATREVLSLNPNRAQTPDAKRASLPLNGQLLQRGVAIRAVYQGSFRNDRRLLDYARWLTDKGGELRVAPTVPLLVVIYDRTTALVPVDPTNCRRGALEIRSPGLVALACALFDHLWLSASAFDVARTGTATDVPATQRLLVRLLAEGQTDEAVARRIGVSVSTLRRMLGPVMTTLRAKSRFQAGVRAAELGWLNSEAEIN